MTRGGYFRDRDVYNDCDGLTADELETWLKGPDSQSSGGSKPDTSGESIGHERCIICDIDHPVWS